MLFLYKYRKFISFNFNSYVVILNIKSELRAVRGFLQPACEYNSFAYNSEGPSTRSSFLLSPNQIGIYPSTPQAPQLHQHPLVTSTQLHQYPTKIDKKWLI